MTEQINSKEVEEFDDLRLIKELLMNEITKIREFRSDLRREYPHLFSDLDIKA